MFATSRAIGRPHKVVTVPAKNYDPQKSKNLQIGGLGGEIVPRDITILGYDQDVNRRLRIDIVKRDRILER